MNHLPPSQFDKTMDMLNRAADGNLLGLGSVHAMTHGDVAVPRFTEPSITPDRRMAGTPYERTRLSVLAECALGLGFTALGAVSEGLETVAHVRAGVSQWVHRKRHGTCLGVAADIPDASKAWLQEVRQHPDFQG